MTPSVVSSDPRTRRCGLTTWRDTNNLDDGFVQSSGLHHRTHATAEDTGMSEVGETSDQRHFCFFYFVHFYS